MGIVNAIIKCKNKSCNWFEDKLITPDGCTCNNGDIELDENGYCLEMDKLMEDNEKVRKEDKL